MRAWLSGILVCGLALIAVGRSWGDEAPFPVPPPKPAGLEIIVKIDPAATVSRLILPPDAAGEDGAGELPPLPGSAPPEAPKGAFFESPLRSILAGLCLSLAIGAVFFVPRTSGVAQMILVGAVGAGVVGIAAAAFADIAPDPVPPPRAGPFASGPVKVEWNGRKGAPITLILAGQAVKNGPGPRVRPPRRAIPEALPLPGSAPPQP